jgi:hypothetical protein
MPPWKLPPKEKIYEAFSVLADKRYIMKESSATVTSSDRKKQYLVEWNLNKNADKPFQITSNDNASYWQGYIGYPIIALLMITGKIQFDIDIVQHFKDIPWNALNKAVKNDYAAVVSKVLSRIENKKIVDKISSEVENIYKQLSELKLERLPGKKRPPKS